MITIGLHHRLTGSFTDIIYRAQAYGAPHFQTFLVNSEGKTIDLTPEIVTYYRHRRDLFDRLYVHSSYRINLANPEREHHGLFERELYFAKKLGFSHVVLHAGAEVKQVTRQQALDTFARRLNEYAKRERDLRFILENSAHGKRSLGGDIDELAYIRSLLDHPEKVGFCIDTAHAHVFGYDLRKNPEAWVAELVDKLGGVELLHLNDTSQLIGSQIDEHCIPGYGQLGQEVLKRIGISLQVPMILELPQVDEVQERAILEGVRSWFKDENGQCIYYGNWIEKLYEETPQNPITQTFSNGKEIICFPLNNMKKIDYIFKERQTELNLGVIQ